MVMVHTRARFGLESRAPKAASAASEPFISGRSVLPSAIIILEVRIVVGDF